MNRFWIGVILAVLLTAFGISADRYGARQCQTLSDLLEQCAKAAEAEDWQQAKVCFNRAENAWKKWKPLARAVYPESALSPLDRMLAALPPMLAHEDRNELTVYCAEGRRMLNHLNA